MTVSTLPAQNFGNSQETHKRLFIYANVTKHT